YAVAPTLHHLTGQPTCDQPNYDPHKKSHVDPPYDPPKRPTESTPGAVNTQVDGRAFDLLTVAILLPNSGESIQAHRVLLPAIHFQSLDPLLLHPSIHLRTLPFVTHHGHTVSAR